MKRRHFVIAATAMSGAFAPASATCATAELSAWHAAVAKGDVHAASAFLAPGAKITTYSYGKRVETTVDAFVARFAKCQLKEFGPGVGWAKKDVHASLFTCPETSTQYDYTAEYDLVGDKIAGINFYANAVAPPSPPPVRPQ